MMRSWGWSPHEWECACAHVYLCLTLRDPVCCGPPGYWSRLPFPPPGDFPDPGIEPASPALAGGLFTTLLPWMRLGHLSKRPGSALAPSVAEDAVERQPSMSPQEALSHQTPSGPVSGALTSSLQNCEKKMSVYLKKRKKKTWGSIWDRREREQLWQQPAKVEWDSASGNPQLIDWGDPVRHSVWVLHSGAKSLRDLGTIQGFFINWVKHTSSFLLSKLCLS